MFVLMLAAAAAAGGFWGGIAGYLKARWNVNEIITTLMLNYVAIHLTDYFVYGPWRDPASLGFPMTAPFPEAARLPVLADTRVHVGILIALVLVLLYRVVLRWTRWGFEIRAIGENPKAADYAGISFLKNAVLVMVVSGALAAIAGMGEIAGLQGRLQPGLSPGYGYTAIIVAWLARLNPWSIFAVSFFMGGLFVGGESLQVVMRLPLSSIQVIQGLILFFVLASEFFRVYRIHIINTEAG
jgi:simple sugar transport system permease protein